MPSVIKEKLVSDLTEEMKTTEHVVVTNYLGLDSEAFNDLRTKLKDVGAKYKVVKNRLAKIALKNVGWNIDDALKGPSAFAYKGTDIASISKVLFQFAKKHDGFKVKAGYLFGEMKDAGTIQAIADLPSKEVLLATLLARMNGPLQSLVATMNEPMRSLHAAISAVAKKKEAAPAA